MSKAEELAITFARYCIRNEALVFGHPFGELEKELRRLAQVERELEDLKASIGEPVATVSGVTNPGTSGVRIKWGGGFPRIGMPLYALLEKTNAE